jgi:hypothetical protein
MELDNFIIGKTKERVEGRVGNKKQPLQDAYLPVVGNLQTS